MGVDEWPQLHRGYDRKITGLVALGKPIMIVLGTVPVPSSEDFGLVEFPDFCSKRSKCVSFYIPKFQPSSIWFLGLRTDVVPSANLEYLITLP